MRVPRSQYSAGTPAKLDERAAIVRLVTAYLLDLLNVVATETYAHVAKSRVVLPKYGKEAPLDRLESMATFLAAIEAGSLSAAARRLKTPLPTVSRRISELELHLRTKLFNRSNRRLVLTDAGSSYVAACKRILAEVAEAERTASGEYAAPTGELVLTAP